MDLTDINSRDVSHFFVCTTCGRLAGPWRKTGTHASEWFVQTCRCHPLPEGEERERWRGFDYNEAATLCPCCMVEPKQSGSRFSSTFCRDCESWFEEFEGEVGPDVTARSNHTLNAGIEPTTDDLVTAMRQAFEGIQRTMDKADRYRRSRVSKIAERFGFGPGEVPLTTWLSKTRRYRRRKRAYVRAWLKDSN